MLMFMERSTIADMQQDCSRFSTTTPVLITSFIDFVYLMYGKIPGMYNFIKIFFEVDARRNCWTLGKDLIPDFFCHFEQEISCLIF